MYRKTNPPAQGCYKTSSAKLAQTSQLVPRSCRRSKKACARSCAEVLCRGLVPRSFSEVSLKSLVRALCRVLCGLVRGPSGPMGLFPRSCPRSCPRMTLSRKWISTYIHHDGGTTTPKPLLFLGKSLVPVLCEVLCQKPNLRFWPCAALRRLLPDLF